MKDGTLRTDKWSLVWVFTKGEWTKVIEVRTGFQHHETDYSFSIKRFDFDDDPSENFDPCPEATISRIEDKLDTIIGELNRLTRKPHLLGPL